MIHCSICKGTKKSGCVCLTVLKELVPNAPILKMTDDREWLLRKAQQEKDSGCVSSGRLFLAG